RPISSILASYTFPSSTGTFEGRKPDPEYDIHDSMRRPPATATFRICCTVYNDIADGPLLRARRSSNGRRRRRIARFNRADCARGYSAAPGESASRAVLGRAPLLDGSRGRLSWLDSAHVAAQPDFANTES